MFIKFYFILKKNNQYLLLLINSLFMISDFYVTNTKSEDE